MLENRTIFLSTARRSTHRTHRSRLHSDICRRVPAERYPAGQGKKRLAGESGVFRMCCIPT